MKAVLDWAKQNVKATVTLAAFGVALTVGWAKGCVVDVSPEAPVAVEAPAAE